MLLISTAPLAVQICSFPKEHGLKNLQQTRYTICVWRRLGVRHKRLRGSGAAPRRGASKTLLGRAIDAGKVCRRGAVFNFPFLMEMFRLHIYGLLVLDQVHWP